MANSIKAQPTTCEVLSITAGMGFVGASGGALASVALGFSMGPVGGAIFGLSDLVVYHSVQWICGEIINLAEPTPNETVLKVKIIANIIAIAIGFFASAGVCILGAAYAGFPITFIGALGLSLATTIGNAVIGFALSAIALVGSYLVSLLQRPPLTDHTT